MERYEALMEQKLDFQGEFVFPRWIRDELSKAESYKADVRDYLKSNSLICHEVATGNPASDRICRAVYSDGYLGWGPVDDWIARGLGGRALYNRLPVVSAWLAKYITDQYLNREKVGMSRPFRIFDLGAGSGSYAFRTLGILRTQGIVPITWVRWVCVDCNDEALEFGSERAKEDGFAEVVQFKKDNFMSSASYPASEADQADLIVLVGVLCGMTLDDAKKCLVKIQPHLRVGGEILAATLLAQSFLENPRVYQLLAKLGWFLKPKNIEEVEYLFGLAGYHVRSIMSERIDSLGKEVPGEYAIVHGNL